MDVCLMSGIDEKGLSLRWGWWDGRARYRPINLFEVYAAVVRHPGGEGRTARGSTDCDRAVLAAVVVVVLMDGHYRKDALRRLSRHSRNVRVGMKSAEVLLEEWVGANARHPPEWWNEESQMDGIGVRQVLRDAFCPVRRALGLESFNYPRYSYVIDERTVAAVAGLACEKAVKRAKGQRLIGHHFAAFVDNVCGDSTETRNLLRSSVTPSTDHRALIVLEAHEDRTYLTFVDREGESFRLPPEKLILLMEGPNQVRVIAKGAPADPSRRRPATAETLGAIDTSRGCLKVVTGVPGHRIVGVDQVAKQVEFFTEIDELIAYYLVLKREGEDRELFRRYREEAESRAYYDILHREPTTPTDKE